jgi:hypothetical protein
MALHTTAASDLRFARCLQGAPCPKCGDNSLAPEASEFLMDGRIQHYWVCDACGTSFRTAVKFSSRLS